MFGAGLMSEPTGVLRLVLEDPVAKLIYKAWPPLRVTHRGTLLKPLAFREGDAIDQSPICALLVLGGCGHICVGGSLRNVLGDIGCRVVVDVISAVVESQIDSFIGVPQHCHH